MTREGRRGRAGWLAGLSASGSPQALRPHAHTDPSRPTAIEWYRPAATPPERGTWGTGAIMPLRQLWPVLHSPAPGRPSCPKSFSPQVYTLPSAATPTEWYRPPATAPMMTPPGPVPSTAAGRSMSPFPAPQPSCPASWMAGLPPPPPPALSLRPQAKAVPSSATARECPPPSAHTTRSWPRSAPSTKPGWYTSPPRPSARMLPSADQERSAPALMPHPPCGLACGSGPSAEVCPAAAGLASREAASAAPSTTSSTASRPESIAGSNDALPGRTLEARCALRRSAFKRPLRAIRVLTLRCAAAWD
mmetsp:Transcript_41405/g.132251  ORF Transcript_41405/g.132251 Transcript_41405/m.132251 type:complete len:305 (+) Transcript_41405:1809-2723(+)